MPPKKDAKADNKGDKSLSVEMSGEDIKNLIDKAIRAALETFRDEFSKLMDARLDSMDDRINMLESDNQALRLAIKDLQSVVQDPSINNAYGAAVSKTVLLPGNADKDSKKMALASLAAVL